ncbi:hypothetical protein BT3_201 [Staphylococcus phage BT3]|uniref:Uncharacterized protein n=2 Tax=Kayvirus TaxID=1857843 RepID=A0A0D3MUZ8_9CAUD|nr:hypothetical protein OZ71_gp180 [Staphylococcus phage MCE-2014]YP_009196005.1 hypothetical protein AVU41_gp169 [Staphylococcus phage phiIPLA-RODI]QVD58162.1 hypothetical protein BT3_201 [Staphylococcus phage BT3]UYE90433.1 hypothetical protein [Staphylococcus phage vB_ScaM-V1SC01]WLY86790.1 hypothetical protein 355Saur083PP_00023 [Staphylococcus phage 355Saur083PP]WLY87013.1 hypothetical protein 357Saur119PP_00030 [Staphylococcus phage 357Saur119PP]WOZ17363.1 hypothetical protein [Staphylo
MNYKEVLEVIKKNKPCKVRFTGSILAIVNKEFNADTDKGILQIDVSNINKDDYIKIQQYCLERDDYTVAGAILF